MKAEGERLIQEGEAMLLKFGGAEDAQAAARFLFPPGPPPPVKFDPDADSVKPLAPSTIQLPSDPTAPAPKQPRRIVSTLLKTTPDSINVGGVQRHLCPQDEAGCSWKPDGHSNAYTVQGHIDAVHRGVTHDCVICGLRLRTKRTLQMHERTVHKVGLDG
jgi:hypothetical protein